MATTSVITLRARRLLVSVGTFAYIGSRVADMSGMMKAIVVLLAAVLQVTLWGQDRSSSGPAAVAEPRRTQKRPADADCVKAGRPSAWTRQQNTNDSERE